MYTSPGAQMSGVVLLLQDIIADRQTNTFCTKEVDTIGSVGQKDSNWHWSTTGSSEQTTGGKGTSAQVGQTEKNVLLWFIGKYIL